MRGHKAKKLEHLNLRLTHSSKEEYEKERAKFIADWTEWEPGGLLSVSRSVHKPEVGEAKWNGYYPNGYESWVLSNSPRLSVYGEQRLIDKINEIVDYLNEERKDAHPTH